MTYSVELLYNQALSLAGSKGQVTSASETSREAELCTTWYDTVKTNVMKAAPWPSLLQDARLVEAAERNWGAEWVSGDPAPQFTFAYVSPLNVLAPRHLHSGARFELTPRFPVPGSELSPTLRELEIMTNDSSPLLRYTANNIDVADWDSGLFSAVAAALSAFISFELTKKVSITDRLYQRAYQFVQTQLTLEANSQQLQYRDMPEGLTARGYTGFTQQTSFFYPYEALLGGPQ